MSTDIYVTELDAKVGDAIDSAEEHAGLSMDLGRIRTLASLVQQTIAGGRLDMLGSNTVANAMFQIQEYCNTADDAVSRLAEWTIKLEEAVAGGAS